MTQSPSPTPSSKLPEGFKGYCGILQYATIGNQKLLWLLGHFLLHETMYEKYRKFPQFWEAKPGEERNRGDKRLVTVKNFLPNTSSAYLSIIHGEIQRQTKLPFGSRYTTEITEAQPTFTLSSNGFSKPAHLDSDTIRAKGRLAGANFLFSLPHATKQSFLPLGTSRQCRTNANIPFLAVKQRMQLKT